MDRGAFALGRLGRADVLLSRMGLWFGLVETGLRTVIEEPEPTRSDCHAWGAHPIFHLYATLLGSVLAVLIGGAIFVYRLLALVLATTDSGGNAPLVDMGHALSVILVATAIGIYHWRVLRSDSAARPATSLEAATPSPVYGGEQGGGVVLTITGATEEEIRRALADLPKNASFTIRK